MRRRTFAMLSSIALGVGLAVAVPAPAFAADGWQRTSPKQQTDAVDPVCEPIATASGCFQPHGEWIWLLDTKANGMPVGVKWRFWPQGSTSATRSGMAYHDRGEAAGWTALNKSFGEGGQFGFQVCEVRIPTHTYSDCSREVFVGT